MSVVFISHGLWVVARIVSTIDWGWRCFLVVAIVWSILVSYFLLVVGWVYHGVYLEHLGGSSLSLSSVLGKVFGQRGKSGWVSGRVSRRVA